MVAVATLAIRLVTTRFGFSLKKLAPDLARLNPLSKLRELPQQNLSSLLQAMVMLPVFLWAVYAIARDKLEACWRCRWPAWKAAAVPGRLADGAVLESRGRLPGLRRGGSVPADAPPPAGSAA